MRNQYEPDNNGTNAPLQVEELINFTPFTPESYQKLVDRDWYFKALQSNRLKYAQEAHLVGGELKFGSQEDEQLYSHENPDLKEGCLFTKSYGSFPPNLLGVAIEELDPGIRDKTFVIINSRNKKNYINRFTATKSLYLFTPWNRLRRATLSLCTHQLFDVFIFSTIITNCFFLAMPVESFAENMEHLFLLIYTLECVIKVIGRGFILSPYTYLRDPWNWLDFSVIIIAHITLMLQAWNPYHSLTNARGLRTFRVLRALKTVSILPGLKTIVSALLQAFKMFFEVILLTVFCLMIFAIFGIQAYQGALRQKCVKNVAGYMRNPSETYDDYYIRWTRNSDNWYMDYNQQYVVCGNNTGAGLCPDGYKCIPNIGENPRYGFMNFDLFGWAALTSFQLIALDFWEDIYNQIIRAKGPWSAIFFMITTYLGSFYMINLMLAVVSTSYEEEALRANKVSYFALFNIQRVLTSIHQQCVYFTLLKQERERDKKESARKKHNALYDISYYHLKVKEGIGNKLQQPTEIKTTFSNTNESAKEVGKMEFHSDITSDLFMPSNFRRISITPSISMDEKLTEMKQSDKITIVKADVLLDPEIGILDYQVIDRNCDCCEKWMCCYISFLRIQNYFYIFVSDPLFDFIITILIIVNTFFMSLEHHNQPMLLTDILEVTDNIFAIVFTFEAFCKIIGLGKYYFLVGWNIFDFITVLASVSDVGLKEIDGLNVLRTFRLLRVLKLAQSWPTMRLLVTIIISTLGALGNLCLILCIVVYIFAVIGLQLFRDSYTSEDFSNDELLRWNFTDFYHSMLMIFRVLCGEWIEPLYQCMRVSSELCIIIFLPALVFGNFIVLNLFLALLLNAFARDSLERHLDTSEERSKLSEGWLRLKQLFCCCICWREKNMLVHSTSSIKSVELVNSQNVNTSAISKEESKTSKMEMNSEAAETERSINECNYTITKEIDLAANKSKHESRFYELQKSNNSETNRVSGKSIINPRYNESDQNTLPVINLVNIELDERESTAKQITLGTFASFRSRVQSTSFKSALENINNSGFNSSFIDESLSGDLESYNFDDDDEMTKQSDLTGPPPNCLPLWMYKRIMCLDFCSQIELWIKVRAAAKRILDHHAFEGVVLAIIIASSITLVFEDIYLPQKPTLELVLNISNIIFAVLFIVEMIIKWIGLGFNEYFTNLWTIFDFFIVLISVASIMGDAMGIQNIAAFRSLRTLRAFRPLRAVSRWQGMKIVVNALLNAIPAIINVFLVCMVFWLIFSIMGVQFFKGHFFKCVDGDGQSFSCTEVIDKDACFKLNATWQNLNINFDTTANGFLALFQVATFEGWMEIIAAAVDSTNVDEQPCYEASLMSYLYFVVFIVIGSFFALNLFIGVIIDNFNVLKKRYEGSYLDAFLTQNQRSYYNTLKKMMKRKPKKIIKRPTMKFQLFFYDLAVSNRFEISVMLLIFLNMTTMAICHYKETELIHEITEMLNVFFTSIFTLEAIVKIIGLRVHYFRFQWNVYDFIIVILSIFGLLRPIFHSLHMGEWLEFVFSYISVMPSMLRIVRIFYIGRVLRLMKLAKGIRKLLFAIIISLPAVMNIGALLFLIMFIYSIIGMSSFSGVKLTGAFNEIVNFQTFGNSFMLLMRLSTAAGWNDILDALLVKEPNCNPNFFTTPDGHNRSSITGDCGIPYLAIPYMVSYILLVWLIVVNMYIAVLLENFNQAHLQEEVGITEDDFDMFYALWEKYDPFASQFIKYEQLGDLVASLDPPLQITKPNDIALISFNIPILEGDKMHCIDILLALVKNVLEEVEDSGELRSLKMQMEAKFSQIFPSRINITVTSTTLQRKKEDVAARTLQRAWRSYKAQEAMRCITKFAQKQKFLRSQFSTFRSPTYIMIDLGNRLDKAIDRFFKNPNSLGGSTPTKKLPATNLAYEDTGI